MTEAFNVAKNTLLTQQVGEKTTKTGNPFQTEKSSPTTASSSKGGSSLDSSSELVRAASMGSEEGENSEIIVEPATRTIQGTAIREETSEKSYTLSDGDRSRNPDPEGESTAGVVVPSVIRISPKSNSGNGKKHTADSASSSRYQHSSRVPFVRPLASKTPPQEEHQSNGKPRPGDQQAARAKAQERKEVYPSMGERGGKGDKHAGRKAMDETKRRDESQTNFPRRNKPKRLTGKTSEAAPTQHVQYSNAGSRHQHHASSRQDPHGHRHHGRGVHAASITSSGGGGTPTLVARRAPQHPRGLSTGSHSEIESETSPSAPPTTPLFQRLVTEEVVELKAYTRIIEEQNRRVTELERRTADLEKRLQKKDKEKADLERTLEYRENEWRNKFEILEGDRNRQRELVEQEKRLNTKLNYQVAQMEQEIHKFLTRKYPTQRESVTTSVRNMRIDRGSPSVVSGSTAAKSPSSPGHTDRKREQFKSPREILENDGTVEVVRKRNIACSLLDFFGMP